VSAETPGNTVGVVGMADDVPGESLAAAALTLARRFAGGATMWCVSPQWPSHGRHVAVEFVHPVIVGKRALPAVNVDTPDLTGSLRLLVRPGDLLLALGTSTPDISRLMRRGAAWGLSTVWLGAGPRPDPSSADHLVWSVNGDAGRAARSGDVVILYHILWELTHVVFEHPGLLIEPPLCEAENCVTCSDEGRVGEVVSLTPGGQAEVVAGGRRESVDVTLIDPVRPGDLLLLHAGTALTLLEEDAP
jgi:HupF/HypC family